MTLLGDMPEAISPVDFRIDINTREASMRFFTAAVILALAPISPAYSQQIFACDLVDPAAASTVLGSAISRHIPARSAQKLDDGSEISDCIFFARLNRDSLRVTLVEYPSVRDAEKSFAAGAVSTDIVKHTRTPGLGDAATWWSIGTEAHGLTLQKGRRVLILDTRWRDSSNGAGLKERITPIAATVTRKL